MAKLRYNYGGKQPGPASDSQAGSKRRLFLFVLLLIIAALAVYLLKRNSGEETPPKVATNPAAETGTVEAPPAGETPDSEPEQPMPGPPAIPPEVAAELATVRSLLEQGEYVQVREKITALLQDRRITEADPAWRECVGLLSAANTKILFTDVPFPAKKAVYIVEPNDSLDKIARQFQTTIEAIQIANKLDLNSSHIRIGQKFRIYQGAWRLLVSKSKSLLYVYDGDELFKIYDIGVGRQNRTPTGDFRVTAKIKEPPWYAPDGRVIPFGDPENILGTRWLDLKPTGETDTTLTGYGIHGTWEKDSEITKPLSNGCIRMRNQDVEELFNILPHQVPVKIEE